MNRPCAAFRTALDADVLKTCVDLGLAVGLMANIAYNAERDHCLARLGVRCLFPPGTAYLAISRDTYLRATGTNLSACWRGGGCPLWAGLGFA